MSEVTPPQPSQPEHVRRLEAWSRSLSLVEMSRVLLEAAVVVTEQMPPSHSSYQPARDYLVAMALRLGETARLNEEFERHGFGVARDIQYGALRFAEAPYVRGCYGSEVLPTIGNTRPEYDPMSGLAADEAILLVDRAVESAILDDR